MLSSLTLRWSKAWKPPPKIWSGGRWLGSCCPTGFLSVTLSIAGKRMFRIWKHIQQPPLAAGNRADLCSNVTDFLLEGKLVSISCQKWRAEAMLVLCIMPQPGSWHQKSWFLCCNGQLLPLMALCLHRNASSKRDDMASSTFGLKVIYCGKVLFPRFLDWKETYNVLSFRRPSYNNRNFLSLFNFNVDRSRRQ